MSDRSRPTKSSDGAEGHSDVSPLTPLCYHSTQLQRHKPGVFHVSTDLLNSLIAKYQSLFDPAAAGFCERVFTMDGTVYADRLRAIGFDGLDQVLDAGCGFGQWTLQLARMNKAVSAIDVDSGRLLFLHELLQAEGHHANLSWSTISDLAFDDESFDGIFSYSVIFIGDWKKCLAEFHRVLKPGGRLYFNFNEIGWFIHLWNNQPNAGSNYDPREVAASAMLNTIEYERGTGGLSGQKVIEEDECRQELEQLGFVDIQFGAEGELRADPSVDCVSFYPSHHDGLRGVREVLCLKS